MFENSYIRFCIPSTLLFEPKQELQRGSMAKQVLPPLEPVNGSHKKWVSNKINSTVSLTLDLVRMT